jgi:signal transduction histidine kinase
VKLRGRLFLAFALVAVLPVGIVGWAGRWLVSTEMAEERQTFEHVVARFLRATVADRVEAVGREVAPVCEGERVVDEVLQALHEGRFEAREYGDVLPSVARARGLDYLELVGPDDRILASTSPRRVGRLDRGRFRHARNGDLVVESFALGQGEEPVVAAACVASDYERIRVAVVGGRALGRLFPEERDATGKARLYLVGADGRPISRGAPSVDLGDHPRVPVLESHPDGAAIVVVAKSASLLRSLGHLDLLVGALAVAALLVAGMLAVWLAGRITQPLSDLAEGARAVAAGDLGVQIDVRGGGEVRELVQAFNTMTSDLAETRERMLQAERIAAWREIARRIAHEIKNPLSPIQTSVETLRKAKRQALPSFDEIFEESTRVVLEEVGRLERIVTEFSQFARMPRPKLEGVDVPDLLAHAVSLHAGGEVPVGLATLPPLPSIRADREQLVQVLVNLVQNAVDACRGRPGAAVEVSAEPFADGVAIVVRDGGTGIAPDVLGKIFDPYFTTKPHGTGLGLAIVHRIVGDHGGRIVAESRTGATTFRVTLPREAPDPGAEDTVAA